MRRSLFLVAAIILLGFVVFPDRYLYALTGEAFTQRCGLYNSRKLLRRVYLELIGEGKGQDGRFASVQTAVVRHSNINEVHLEASCSLARARN